MNVNLDTLKAEILDYMESSGFAVFHASPGEIEQMSTVSWDVDAYPDYRVFLETATRADARMILFTSRPFDIAEIDGAVSQLDEAEATREERRTFERRLNEFRRYEGQTCSLELGFSYESRMYVYEVMPDWYEEYLDIVEEIQARMQPENESGDSMNGFYSNN